MEMYIIPQMKEKKKISYYKGDVHYTTNERETKKMEKKNEARDGEIEGTHTWSTGS